jgi:hypothetical protein
LELEFLTGLQVVNRTGLCGVLSLLQRINTQTPEDIQRAIATGQPAMGMGGSESEEEVFHFMKNPLARLLALTMDGEVIGFHSFCISQLTMDFYKHYLDHENQFPKELKNLKREQIGFGGTVIMQRANGDQIELPTGHYNFTHAIMIAKQIISGKELVVDWCFEGNAALDAHKRLGYQVLSDQDGKSLKFKSSYETLTDEGKELVIIFCKTHTAQQKALLHEVLATLERDDLIERKGNLFDRDPEDEIIGLLRRAIKLTDNTVPLP